MGAARGPGGARNGQLSLGRRRAEHGAGVAEKASRSLQLSLKQSGELKGELAG